MANTIWKTTWEESDSQTGVFSKSTIQIENQWLLFLYESLLIIGGCLLAGLIPWCLKQYANTSKKYLNMCTIFGAGLLAGVCLILIIPEGAEYLYEMEEYPYDTPAEAQMIGTCLMGGFILLLFSEKLFGSDHGKGSSIGIGMIIHGASDGVALAAANWTENSALEWIIFVGIFLHKLPASFGLSASIVNQPDMTKWSSLLMILGFTFSAPVGGFVTLAFLEALGSTSESVIPGALLLVSAGTVLYVALCHIIPECFSQGIAHDHEDDEIGIQTKTVKKSRITELIELSILCLGLLIPLVLVYTLPED